MKKIFLFLTMLGTFVALTACGPTEAGALKINFTQGNSQRHISYQQSSPLTMPDGTVVNNGDLKPVWQQIEKDLEMKIEDASQSAQKGNEMIDLAAADGFKSAHIYGANGVASSLMDYGANKGVFVKLDEHMDKMPDLKKFLDDNPDIKAGMTASDGHIYHVGYSAEIGNYARTFNARAEWVRLLLDEDKTLETETKTLTSAYEAYWVGKDAPGRAYTNSANTNVVSLQNNVETKNLEGLRTALINYIDTNYPNLTNRSDLYLGTDAQYDVDELVALWRVMFVAPNTLSKQASGSVVSDAIIVPFFARQLSHRDEILRLVNYFGGQRVFGADSYGSKFYLDKDGNLQFAFNEDGFLDGIDKLKELYSEGLIHQDMSEDTGSGGNRNALFGSDDADNPKTFGFMTIDWIASTTAINYDDVYKIEGILPPLTTLDGEDGMVHWMDNGRAMKPDGWSISVHTKGADLDNALKLFNHFFTDEGHRLQNYGTADMTKDGKTFAGSDGVNYPEFNDWVRENAQTFKKGDLSSFLRDYVGAILPIGYQKEIGFEYQYTSSNGVDAWALYQDAEVLFPTYGNDNPMLKMVPPVFSFTTQESGQVANTNIGDDQTSKIFAYIGGTTGDGVPSNKAEIKKLYTDAGVETYINMHKAAYARMSGNS